MTECCCKAVTCCHGVVNTCGKVCNESGAFGAGILTGAIIGLALFVLFFIILDH